MRVARLAAALVLAPAACLFPDLGNLEATDASLIDAPSDIVAETAAETSTDAGPADGDALAPYCASLSPAPAFCEDFDNGPYGAQFTSKHVSSNGILGADDAAFTSPPISLFSGTPIEASTGDQGYMTRSFGTNASKITYAFSMRVDSVAPGDKSAVIAAIDIGAGSAMHTLSFYITDTYAAVEEVYGADALVFQDHKFSIAPTLGTWTHIELDVDLAAKTCSAKLDGAQALTTTTIDSSWAPGALAVDLGISYVSTEIAAWSVRYDDVTVDWQ